MGHAQKLSEDGPRRLLLIGAAAVGVLMVFVMGAIVIGMRDLQASIVTEDAFGKILGTRPPDETGQGTHPIDILVIGDDTRRGHPDITPGLGDTTVLLHLSARRTWDVGISAYAVSIPRDLMVERPACASRDDPSQVIPAAGPVMWNAAYALGGAACTIAQFEHMTEIRIDHFVVVKFEGFERMVNALGGVPVCLPETVQAGDVTLPAGSYEVRGDRALRYVQERKTMGDGSDIGRMLRQQRFMAAMVEKSLRMGLLSHPIQLYRFLQTATGSLVTDPGLGDISALLGLALEMRGITEQRVQLFTMPIAGYAPDPNRLISGEGADRLWAQLRADDIVDKRFTGNASLGQPGTGSGGPGMPGAMVRMDQPFDPHRYGLC